MAICDHYERQLELLSCMLQLVIDEYSLLISYTVDCFCGRRIIVCTSIASFQGEM